jgi:hypothetical protein
MKVPFKRDVSIPGKQFHHCKQKPSLVSHLPALLGLAHKATLTKCWIRGSLSRGSRCIEVFWSRGRI